MKNYNNNEELSYIQYLDANNLYGWAMSKKLPVNGFKWIDNNETAELFLKLMLNIQRDYTNYLVIYRSYQNEWK